jgi:PASTA domain
MSRFGRRVLSGLALVPLVVVGAACSSGTSSAKPTPATVAASRAKLEFRKVLQLYPASSKFCDGTTVFDRSRKVCYRLGPVLLTGKGITKATVVYDSTMSQSAVQLHWGDDDFVTKIARPLTNETFAFVLDGVVLSAPNMNPGFTGRDVEIAGNFSRSDANAIAASINGVPTTTTTAESSVVVPDVVGKTAIDSLPVLATAGLTPWVVPPAWEDMKVVRQSPKAGSKVRRKSEVAVCVDVGSGDVECTGFG